MREPASLCCPSLPSGRCWRSLGWGFGARTSEAEKTALGFFLREWLWCWLFRQRCGIFRFGIMGHGNMALPAILIAGDFRQLDGIGVRRRRLSGRGRFGFCPRSAQRRERLFRFSGG